MQPGYAHGDDPEPTEAGNARRSSPGADRDDAGRRAPRLHGMDNAQDRPSRCRRDDSRPDDGADDRPHAGRRGWTQTAGRTIAGTDAQPVRGGAQSRTEDAQPQPVRIAEDTSIHLSL